MCACLCHSCVKILVGEPIFILTNFKSTAEVLRSVIFYVIADKTLTLWKLTRDELSYGIAEKSLTGHGHFVSDVTLSTDGQFALSGSWDKTLRLWDLHTYVLTKENLASI